jgi:hypothetical protein
LNADGAKETINKAEEVGKYVVWQPTSASAEYSAYVLMLRLVQASAKRSATETDVQPQKRLRVEQARSAEGSSQSGCSLIPGGENLDETICSNNNPYSVQPQPLDRQWSFVQSVGFVNLTLCDGELPPAQDLSTILDKVGLPIDEELRAEFLHWHRLHRVSNNGSMADGSRRPSQLSKSETNCDLLGGDGAATAREEWSAAFQCADSVKMNSRTDKKRSSKKKSVLIIPAVLTAEEEAAKKQRLLALINKLRENDGKAPLDRCPSAVGPDGTQSLEGPPAPPITALVPRSSETVSAQAAQGSREQVSGVKADKDPGRFKSPMSPTAALSVSSLDNDSPDAQCAFVSPFATAGSPPDASVPAFVDLAWPEHARSEIGPCAANVLERKCTPEQISVWATNALGERYDALRAAWVEKVALNSASIATLEQALVDYLGQSTVDPVFPLRLSLKRILPNELRERVCKAGDDLREILVPIEHLDGLALVEPVENPFHADHDASLRDVNSMRRLRTRVRDAQAHGSSMALTLARSLAGLEAGALRLPIDPVVLSVEAVRESERPADAAQRLAQRLLGVNRIAAREHIHTGLLVEGWDRGRIMVLVQYPVLHVTKAATTAIWVTPPARTAEQLADYMLLSVLCRDADLRDLLGKLDRVNGGGLLQEYNNQQVAIDRHINEAISRSNRELLDQYAADEDSEEDEDEDQDQMEGKGQGAQDESSDTDQSEEDAVESSRVCFTCKSSLKQRTPS